jgi:O-antigen ligase
VLLTLSFCVVVAHALLTGQTAIFTKLRPLVIPFAPYVVWMAVLAAAHLGVVSGLQSGQRLELFLFPVMIGLAIALHGLAMPFLKAYLLTATVFAALYPLFSDEAGGLGAQKNPAGQFIANGLLLLIAVKELRGRLLFAAPLLTLGLLWTQSRGAILSVIVGLVVLLLIHPGRDRLRFVALLIPIAAVAIGAFALLPNATKVRNTSFTVSTDTRAGYSLEIRETFRRQAWQLIHAEPVFGTGVGRYADGVDGIRPTTQDPHQVLLFQAAEGGYPFAVGFAVLVLGSAAVIAWRGRRTVLGPAAAALLLATAGHGLVDVYWVRGTPVLSWLVVGMVIGQLAQAAPTARTKAGEES